MNLNRAFAALLVAILALVPVAASRAQSPELKALQEQYDKLLNERVTEVYKSGLAKLDADYVANVERGLADATSAGELKSVLPFRDELRRIAAKEGFPADDKEAPDPLKKLRIVYRTELAKLGEQRASNYSALLTPYVEKLKQLEVDLTKAVRVDEAKAVMDYRKNFVAAGVPANVTVGAPMNASRIAVVAVEGKKIPFEDGAKAYTNRKYPVTHAPKALAGLKFLQVPGGTPSARKIELKSKGVLYVACVIEGEKTDVVRTAIANDRATLATLGFNKTDLGFNINNLVLKVYSKVVDGSFTLPPSNAFCGFVIIGNLE